MIKVPQYNIQIHPGADYKMDLQFLADDEGEITDYSVMVVNGILYDGSGCTYDDGVMYCTSRWSEANNTAYYSSEIGSLKAQLREYPEGLDCFDHQYDYVKIEEEKNKPIEEENKENKDDINKDQKENEEIVDDKEKEKEEEKKEEIKEKENEEEKIEKPKIKTKMELEKENEFKLLEKKSEVLRRYLAENVLPLLSLGILHVANERPDDPVEALADYLLAKTFEMKKNEDIKENNNEIEIEKDKNESIDLTENKKEDIKLELEFEPDDKNLQKKTGRISPIHRENSDQFNLDNNGSDKQIDENKEIEDDLNKAMIESND